MVAEAFLMRGAMAMALLLLLGLCSVSLSGASALPSDGLNQKSLDFTSGRLRHRSLLQASPTPTPTPAPAPPAPAPAPPASPTPTPASRIAPILPPSPKEATPASSTQTRVYLMWVGIGAFILVLTSAVVFCLCRKFGQHKISRGQRLPPMPRYH